MAENQVIIDIQIDSKEAQRRAERLTATISAQREELKAWRKVLRDSGGTNKEAAQEVSKLERAIKENNKELRQAQKEATAEANSINALRASVSKLTKERNNLNTSTAEGQARFKQLTATIREQTDELKELESAVGDNRRNVGNYSQGVFEALQANSAFNDILGKTAGAFDVLKVSTVSFGVALTALPILAIIGALTIFFTKTREGTKLLKEFAGAVQAVFGRLTQDIGQAVGAFIDFISKIESAGDAFNKFSNAVRSLSWDGLVEGASNYADELARVAANGRRLAQQTRRAEGAIRRLNIEASEQQRIAEENRKLRDDETKSFEERIRANNAVLQAEQKRRDALLEINRQTVKQIEIEARLAGLRSASQDPALLDRLIEAEKEKQEILEDFAGRTTEQLTEQNALRREQLQAQAQFEASQLEERLIRQELAGEEELRLRLAVLSKLEEAEKVGISEASEAFKLIEQQFLNERLKLRKEFADKLNEQQVEAIAIEVQAVADVETSKTQILLDEEVKRSEIRKQSLEEQKKISEAETQIQQLKLQAFGDVSKAVLSIFGEESVAAKAAFLVDKAVAVADVIIKTQQANALLAAQLGVASPPAIAANTARGAASVATILATTLQGFASGGYTGDGGRYEPAGIVHRGEFVVSKPAVAKLGGAANVARITGQPMKGYANGGAVGLNMTSNVNRTRAMTGLSNDLKRMQVQVAVTDIAKAQSRFNQIQTAVNQ